MANKTSTKKVDDFDSWLDGDAWPEIPKLEYQ